MVLGHSRMLWGRFVLHQDLQTLLRCHTAAFRRWAACRSRSSMTACARCSIARIRTPATSSTIARCSAFAHHYGYLPKACKAYRAKTKGKVERPFRYIREDFFLGRSFRDLDDLNAQFRQWLDQVANVRTHATTKRVVAEHFAEERPALQPLTAGSVPGRAAARAAHHARWHRLCDAETLKSLRMCRKVADLHILDQPMTKSGLMDTPVRSERRHMTPALVSRLSCQARIRGGQLPPTDPLIAKGAV